MQFLQGEIGRMTPFGRFHCPKLLVHLSIWKHCYPSRFLLKISFENPNKLIPLPFLFQLLIFSMSCNLRTSLHCCNAGKHEDQFTSSSNWHRSNNLCNLSTNGDLIVFCHCEVRAWRMISSTPSNPGRPFYRFPFWRNRSRSCRFFEW